MAVGKEKIKMEIWKDIKGYEGKYQVSNLGRIKNIQTNCMKMATLQKKYIMKQGGYYQITLWKGKHNGKTYLIHRLVAQHFIPNPDNLPQVNHIDHDRSNNRVDNLEWCTAKYNSNHKRNNRKPLGE